MILNVWGVFKIKMSRESRVEEAVLPDLSSLTKEEQRAVRGMVLLHTMNPNLDEDKTVNVVTRLNAAQKVVQKEESAWPKSRRSKR